MKGWIETEQADFSFSSEAERDALIEGLKANSLSYEVHYTELEKQLDWY